VQRPLAAAALAALALSRADAPPPAAPDDPLGTPTDPPARELSNAALPAHADDVADYTLHAKLDPATHTIAGTGTIHFRNASTQPVHELWLHLYLNAFKNERSDFLRERVGGRGSQKPESWGSIDLRRLAIHEADGTTTDLLPRVELRRPGDDDETDARVPLPRDLPPGASIDLDVTFDDKLPIVVERTGYRDHFHMVGQWFPKLARLEPDGTWAHFPFHHLSEFYADFGTYDVTLDVPAAYTIGATGPTVEARFEAGRRIERHVQGDIHDFAWTAWDRWQTRRESIDGVLVTVLYPPGFDDMAARDLAALRFALPYEAARYGPYPYEVLTVVHPQDDASEAGGMEYPTLITSDGPWLTPKQIFIPEIVTVHELGHQWFYGLVATNEAAWPFLDEGINQFAETDAMGRWRGAGSAADIWGLALGDDALQATASNRAVQDEPVAQPAASFSTGANYGRLVYSRTAAVLDTLARVYGEEALMAALGEYARRFRFQHPGPEQLLGVFAETMGADVAAMLRTALFDKGWVDYAVDDVRDTSVLVRRRGTLRLPVDVELAFEDGSTRRERWDGAGDSKRIAASGTLRAAVVDPDHRVTIDANLENNSGAAPGAVQGAPRTLERVPYWLQLAVQTVSP
jgi:Peptidase family M1 domain